MNELKVIKIGGNVIEDSILFDSFLNDFAKLKGGKILVHGGGKDASNLAKKLGVNVNIIDGRRITDLSSLEVTTMIYAGKINKFIVGKLQGLNCNAIGISGADGNSISAVKRPIKEIEWQRFSNVDVRLLGGGGEEEDTPVAGVSMAAAATGEGPARCRVRLRLARRSKRCCRSCSALRLGAPP